MLIVLYKKIVYKLTSSIYIKLLFSIVIISIITIISYGLIRIEIEAQTINNEIENKIKLLRVYSSRQFSNPVWHFNKPGIQSTAETFLKDEEVGLIRVTTVNGEVLIDQSKLGEEYLGDKLIYINEAIYSEEGEYIAIVTLGYTIYFRNKQLQREIIGFLVSILALVVIQTIFVTFFTRRISRPIIELNNSAKAIAVGNLDQAILTDANDELGELSKSFNHMVQELKLMIKERDSAFDEVAKANEDLESKVEERTTELYAMNQELTAVNDELIDSNSQLHDALKNLENTQQQLARTEKLASLTFLIAGVAHEINTPLGICVTANTYNIMNTENLINNKNLEIAGTDLYNKWAKEISESNEMIQRGLEKATQLIENLKNLTKFEINDEENKFSVITAINKAVAEFEIQHKIIPNIFVKGEETIEIKGSISSFIQIIISLLNNSLIHGFANPENGTINISVKDLETKIQITYKDNGKGIEKKYLANIFEPFFTTNRGRGSVGLGLFTVHEIVTLQFSGTVDCLSKSENGVLFTIELPVNHNL